MLTQKEQGQLFRELIKAKGLTHFKLAVKTGYAPSCISRLCTGERPISGISLATAYAITNALNLSSIEVFCDLVGVPRGDVTRHASTDEHE